MLIQISLDIPDVEIEKLDTSTKKRLYDERHQHTKRHEPVSIVGNRLVNSGYC